MAFCCKFGLGRAKNVFVLQYRCNFSAVGCSQVELSMCHTSKFDSYCAYLFGEIRVQVTNISASLGLPIQFVDCCLGYKIS